MVDGMLQVRIPFALMQSLAIGVVAHAFDLDAVTTIRRANVTDPQGHIFGQRGFIMTITIPTCLRLLYSRAFVDHYHTQTSRTAENSIHAQKQNPKS